MKLEITAWIKIIFLLLISFVITLSNDLWVIFPIGLILILSIIILKLIDKMKPRMKALMVVSLFIFLFQIFFHSSQSIEERVANAILISLKITTLSLIVLLYTSLSSISEILTVLSFLPKKLQLALTITFSLIPLIMDESGKIKAAQISRGFRINQILFWRNIFPVLIPLLHRSFRRAEQLTLVLLSRGYEEQ